MVADRIDPPRESQPMASRPERPCPSHAPPNHQMASPQETNPARPIPRTEPTRYWNALRLVLGLCFLGACGQVWIDGDVLELALR